MFIITETKVQKDEPKIEGFTFFNDERKYAEKSGGGLGIYIKNNLVDNLDPIKIEEVDNMTLFRFNGKNNQKLDIFAIYGPCENKKIGYKEKFYNSVLEKMK